MEVKRSNVRSLTLVLTGTAGFCDSLTFTCADKIFSGQVTGNLLIFSSHLITGTIGNAAISLLTIPVFILAVMTGGWLSEKYSNRYLFLVEGSLLLAGGSIALMSKFPVGGQVTTDKYLVTLMIVFALGIQNAFGNRFPKYTFGITTMMAGNLITLAINTEGYWNSGYKKQQLLKLMIRGLFMLSCFLAGCILGAYSGKVFGLSGAVLPGLTVMLLWFMPGAISGLQDSYIKQ